MNFSEIPRPDTSFWKGKKVLVTGHTGYKGSWLTLWLLKMNANVSGIGLKPEYSTNLFDELNIEKDINHIICLLTNLVPIGSFAAASLNAS